MSPTPPPAPLSWAVHRRRLQRTAAALAIAAASAATTACSSDEGAAASTDGATTVVASTDVYADIAASVGGDLVETSSFISSPDQDPHSYEASARDILAIDEADVVIENGGGYDDFMDQLLDSASADPVVLDAVAVSGVTAPAGGELNEHVWYDLQAMQKLATRLADKLGAADPDHADTYRENATDFVSEVQTLVGREAELKRQYAGTSVAITEPVPGYLLDAIGLDNVTPAAFSEAVEEGEDVSVSVLDDTLSLFTEHQVDAIVYNEQTTGPITDQVLDAAEEAGIPVVGVTETLPDGDHYVSWMASNLDEIEQGLDAS